MTETRSGRRQRRRAGACVLAGILAVGCNGGGPTTPRTPAPPPPATPLIPTGPALFDVVSEETVCTAKTPAWGFGQPHAVSPVTIAADGGEWVARSESPSYGDVEIRLALTGTDPTERVATGSIRGTVIDFFSIIGFPNPSQVTLGGVTAEEPAVLTGSYFAQAQGAFGTVSGKLVYTDNQRGVMTCTEGRWFLFPTRR